MIIPTPTAIPSYSSTNYAPLKPLLSLHDSAAPTPHYIKDALKERKDHLDGLQKSVWREIYNVGMLVDLFCAGKQLVTRDPRSGLFVALTPKREDESTMRAQNMMQFYENQCITKDISSNPDILVRPAKATDNARAAAKGGQAIVDHYSDKFYTPEFVQRDARLCFRFGVAINRVRYDPAAPGIVVYRELAEQRTIQIGEGSGYCGECEYEGSLQEFISQPEEMPAVDEMPQAPTEACPQCGSAAVSLIPPATGQVPTVTGVEAIQMGDLTCDILPLPGCKWDLAFPPEISSWFLYKQSVNFHAIKSILGQIKLGDAENEDFGLQVMTALARSGQALGGRSKMGADKDSEANKDNRTVTEMYLSAQDIGDIQVRGDEQTLGGQPLQPGTLDKTFPDGCVSVWLDSDTLLGLYAENHKKIISSRPWFQRPLTGVGRGGADMIEPQKRENVLDSQIMRYWNAVGTPAVLYDKDAVSDDEVDYIGHPGTSIPVDMARMIGENRKLSDATHQMQPVAIQGAFYDYVTNHQNNAMQIASHIIDFSGGLPGVNNKTATGAQILDSNANVIWTPTLQLKASARRRQQETVLSLYPKHFPMEREFALGGDYSKAQGIAISGADLDTDLWLQVAQNSEQPRSPYIRRQNLNDCIMMLGGIQGYLTLKQSDPQQFEEITQMFDLDLPSGAGNSENVSQMCAKRVSQLTQAVAQEAIDPMLLMATPEMLGMPEGGDPMQVQAMQQQMAAQLQAMQSQAIQSVLIPPVSTLEPAQMEKAVHLQNWLDTDMGQDSPPVLRKAVEILIAQHFEYFGQQSGALALQAGQTQLAGEMPGMAAGVVGQHLAPQKEQPPKDKDK